MNTSKQVNVMIGLLFVAFLVFGAYIVNEPNRSATAEEAQDELLAARGATLFVNNCRTCHGINGLGTDEGAVAPHLNTKAFWILPEDNEYGVPATPEGEARSIRTFLFNTIACGRANTAMPTWSERYGGPLSETQINYLVDMITTNRWDIVEEVGLEHDEETLHTQQVAYEAALEAYQNPGTATPAPVDPGEPPTLESVHDAIVISPGDPDAASLAVNGSNCGQYNGVTAKPFRDRDPLAAAVPGGTGEPGGSAEPTEDPASLPEAQTQVQGMLVGDFFLANCAACHGDKRQGGVGPSLQMEIATQPDQFYIDCITNGRPGTAMPNWSAAGLTGEEISNLVQFIKHVPS